MYKVKVHLTLPSLTNIFGRLRKLPTSHKQDFTVDRN